MNPILWTPDQERAEGSQIMAMARELGFAEPDPIDQLWHWSIENPEAFWQKVWDLGQVRASRPAERVLAHGEKMPGAIWFQGARLNFAENLLRRDDATPALIFVGEDGTRREI